MEHHQARERGEHLKRLNQETMEVIVPRPAYERYLRYVAREERRKVRDKLPPVRTFAVNVEAYENTYLRAVDIIRKECEDKEMPIGRCIELALADWLAGRR